MIEFFKGVLKRVLFPLDLYAGVCELPPPSPHRPVDFPMSNHYASTKFRVLKAEYEYIWGQVTVRPEWIQIADRAVHNAIKNKALYQAVAYVTKVPWFFVAALHMRESNFDCTKHLYNGDPLTDRTVHVPKGRPETGHPPFSFVESAIDAMQYMGYSSEDAWDVATTFYCLEGWNGHGYRHASNECTPANACPYVYSGTFFYLKGKFVADHNFDPNAKDAQLGVMAFLKHLSEVEQVF